ncbi:DUF2778 domain-containing protein [Mesorhizobium sp. LHD-90]|uniref:DUF2778 domain-containing protein n=1 Tax=Mesorhizobium sp. LHD-90 TaxID=3071414 RepID=UPI0027E198AE|nr:DUF2778 domain-containing protein [Mesorhizobium sp. LHD-90]MDQ6438019.1 DUF2778 domain-containing protein [Mesorhizobium sp. LHD-90]
MLAGVSSIGASFASSPNLMPQGLGASTEVAALDPAKRETLLRQARASLVPNTGLSEKSPRLATGALPPIAGHVAGKGDHGFEKVVASAALTPRKIAAAFARAGLGAKAQVTANARVVKRSPTAHRASLPKVAEERFARLPSQAVPVLERFARGGGAEIQPNSEILLAYADPSPFGAGGALSDASVLENNGLVMQSPLEDGSEDSAALPGYEDTPDSTPLPLRRPKADAGKRSDDSGRSDDDKPRNDGKRVDDDRRKDDDRRPVRSRTAVDDRDDDDRSRITQSQRGAPSMLAFAKPDDPAEQKGGGIFKNFSNTPKAGGGTAVYDISAKTVYMPDGTRLEAHSGIGAMADNPRYVHVKMKGPTPPGTYNLVMREKRFHGVEAVRMLPANGKVAHNRTGILAHSYLLRGGRAESHGCVAFKDYNRFLTAFKRGKITRIVVVPGGGKSKNPVRVASAGRGA